MTQCTSRAVKYRGEAWTDNTMRFLRSSTHVFYRYTFLTTVPGPATPLAGLKKTYPSHAASSWAPVCAESVGDQPRRWVLGGDPAGSPTQAVPACVGLAIGTWATFRDWMTVRPARIPLGAKQATTIVIKPPVAPSTPPITPRSRILPFSILPQECCRKRPFSLAPAAFSSPDSPFKASVEHTYFDASFFSSFPHRRRRRSALSEGSALPPILRQLPSQPTGHRRFDPVD
ncbi:hypothetical protein VTI74DRAFT_10972 [Chaetomium olivicolor]